MTLSDAKRKALMILDEYSSGGSITQDADIMNKMNDFFDMAQKDMASYKKIIKQQTYTLTGTAEVTLPSDFQSFFRTWKDGKQRKHYTVIGNKLQVNNETGTLLIEYFAIPTTINSNTLDTYTFEVSEDAANCLPFYVAAQQLITDLVVDYGAIWNMYLQHKSNLVIEYPESGFGGVAQTLFRG